ncbi:uncharacterized protein KY384_009213 [Bacidia gigantensis]|uniref:uncharacterized protein n=1 Tax=Bacidia gigantensis TaxID=2732470 RepID=UPI001D037836|nr:uncharacterized protein KY384_009213 [Bacidia gigantensis]KAG8525569.1 hypothetical protein KY384_009213 [Bacidia gigantensis]
MGIPDSEEATEPLFDSDTLHQAATNGDENTIRSLLLLASKDKRMLNIVNPVDGRTALIVASREGHLEIVRHLIDARADPHKHDPSGWTAQEYAAFRGHIKLAQLLAEYASQDSQESERIMATNETAAKSGRPLERALDQRPQLPSYHGRDEQHRRMKTQGLSEVFVTLGSNNSRSSATVLELKGQPWDQFADPMHYYKILVGIAGGHTGADSQVNYFLPLPKDMVNRPMQFFTKDLDQATLMFEVHSTHISRDGEKPKILGRATALLSALRHGSAPKRESLVRDFTVPVLHFDSMNRIGTLTFSVLIATPYEALQPLPDNSSGFRGKDGLTQIVGHRGSGANSAARTNLQIGENTMQSFITAGSLGASCVEFDVQLTKDHVPVIHHDPIIMQTGGDVLLSSLTYEQFKRLTISQASNAALLNSAEARYIARSGLSAKNPRPRLRSNSLPTSNLPDPLSDNLTELMSQTLPSRLFGLKGNIRGISIQEPSCTLNHLLTSLPGNIDFNIEIKHTMLFEAEYFQLPFETIEVNHLVDIILDTVFREHKGRNITFSSFNPEVCILLKVKQDTFPVLFISKAGVIPVGDPRAGSLEAAVDFAKAWGLEGVVMLSDVFVLAPRLVGYVRSQGLVCASYGALNDQAEHALTQADAGLDAIITNKVNLIARTLKQER